ncbi:MAG: asparagine synthase (glutamine-hydrolyzing) [Hyphomonadaceae bacterium]|nr:asparagine synthase (glutamine-hydrolyzing) [Hyphomonadaceae bacterium]
MCGIAGLRRLDGASVNPAILDRMTDTLVHRGPDGRGVHRQGPVGLGHRRLAIRGLGADGAQPMSDVRGRIWVTYNGEIYNDREIARDLERDFGFVRRTTCDTEILPAGFLAWGAGLFQRLEGMFAIAIWDAENLSLTLARDAAGIKPLFVQTDAHAIRFASEIKALLADPATPRRIDPATMLQYLALGYCGPRETLLADIAQVPPGTSMTHDGVRWTQRTFWRPRRAPDIMRLDDAVAAVGATLDAVVNDMLIADVPLGVLQSGGIDSSLVSLSLRAPAETPLFTARFADASHDETPLARLIAAKIGARHEIVDVEAIDDPTRVFRTMACAVDGQLFDSSGYAFLILAEAIRGHVTVALSGDGADEFFAGYPTLQATRIAGAVGRMAPRGLMRAAANTVWMLDAAAETRMPPTETAGRFLSGLPEADRAHARWRQLAPDPVWRSVLGPALRATLAGFDPFAGYVAAMGDEGSLPDRAMIADQRHHLPADMLRKVDAMSMAASLEIRVPFLDRRMMDLAGRIDFRVLRDAGGGKRPLRRLAALKGAPDALAGGPKRGFNTPVARLLRGPLAALAGDLLDTNADRLSPLLDPMAVRALWRDHAARRANHGYLLWAILVFAVWTMEEEKKGVGVSFA